MFGVLSYMYMVRTLKRTKYMISESQIKHASEWVVQWYNRNLPVLKTKGILAIDIWDEYASSTPFPLGVKAFSPMLMAINLSGGNLEKKSTPNGNLYISFQKGKVRIWN